MLLVNAVSDGMNLVAKEGPLVNGRDGVLVLSENAGAYEELARMGDRRQPVRCRGARPRHCTRHSSMERGERRRRAEGLRAQVREHDVAALARGLLADLEPVAT